MMFTRFLAGLMVLSTFACGGISVDRLSLSDPRLPVDARRWVADAEDAVVISRARRDEAQRAVKAMVKWQAATLASPPFKGAKGSNAQLRRDQMGLSRIEATKTAYFLASAELGLSKARLQLIYAETATRQDIAVYNMPPLQAAVDKALQAVIALRDRHRQSREAELKATDDWWKAWRSYVADKSDTRPFWTIEE